MLILSQIPVSQIKLYQIGFIKNLKNLLPIILFYQYDNHTLNITIRLKDLFFVLTTLNLHSTLQYKILTSITCIDYPDRKSRFELVYELLSIRFNSRVRIKILVNEVTPVISVYSIFSAST